MKRMAAFTRHAVFSILFVGLVGGGCASFDVLTPNGFVKLDKQTVPYKAVSADGAVLMVRKWDNKPPATLAFWQEVVTRELLKQRGYKLTKPQSIRSKGGIEGQLYSGTAEYRGQRHSYRLALYVTEKTIYALEAAAPLERSRRHAVKMKAFCQSLSVE
jgi:hypothetical protein